MKVKFSRELKYILILGILFLLSITALFELKIWPQMEMASWYLDPTASAFPLNDKEATYEIVKGGNGAYELRYSFLSDGKTTGISDFIGSSKVDLDKYMGKPILLNAAYRKTFGRPLCWNENLCTLNKFKRARVIDIESINAQSQGSKWTKIL